MASLVRESLGAVDDIRRDQREPQCLLHDILYDEEEDAHRTCFALVYLISLTKHAIDHDKIHHRNGVAMVFQERSERKLVAGGGLHRNDAVVRIRLKFDEVIEQESKLTLVVYKLKCPAMRRTVLKHDGCYVSILRDLYFNVLQSTLPSPDLSVVKTPLRHPQCIFLLDI